MARRVPSVLALLLALGCAVAGSAVAATSLNEYPLPTKDRNPEGIARGPEGNVWFAESGGAGAIGRITPGGTITEFTTGLTSNSQPTGIVAGPDGNLWFTEQANPGRIGRITPSGTITEFTTGLTANSQPTGIAAGPDGNMWFTEQASPGRIGRITPEGAITEFSSGVAGNQPRAITAGPDGNLWYTEFANPGRIGRITINGTVTQFTTPTSSSQPTGITAGNDGNVYFTELKNSGLIGRITPAGTLTETETPTNGSQPEQIVTGANGNLWFTEQGAHGQTGTMTVAPGAAGGSASPTEQTAILKGLVTPNSQATTYSFEYGETASYGQSTATGSAGAGASQVPVSTSISGLAPATDYHFRVVATNASGTTYGPDSTFTTTEAPAATTAPAASVSLTGALLRAQVNPHAQATTYHFEYGTTTAYGQQMPLSDEPAGSDEADHAVQAGVEGLTPDTSYHYRVVASNCGGCAEGTIAGADETFTTAAPPTAITEAPGAVSATTAAIAGAVNPQGAATVYHFEYGETASYGNETPSLPAGADAAVHHVGTELSGLAAGRTYHFRIVATNCEGCLTGTSYGQDLTFTTPAPPAPAVPAPGNLLAPAPGPGAVAPPKLGRSASVEPLSGTVTARIPGGATVPLTDLADLPVGTVIDVSRGTLALTTATDNAGHTQSATLWGGSFSFSQSTKPGGMTTFRLTSRAAGCRSAHGSSLASAAARKPRPATLWAKDHNGHFSSRGQNSVATVRGTVWGTSERCGGTLTTVREGTVRVRPRHGRAVTVRAGHSYLARR